MSEKYSVKAILTAADKGFASTMKSAMGYATNLKTTLTSGLGFGVMMAAGQKAFSVVTGSMSGLAKETVSTSDSMQKLQQAMRFSGETEDEIQRIAGATGTLKTYADKTVFSLEDVMSTFGALSANGIKDADKMTEAVGNAVAVFGGGAQEFSSVGLAFSQAMASGALHAQDWNQILNASPQLAGGLKRELIKLNPVLGKDFKKSMEDGAITADLLGQAMNNIGMTDLAKEAATSVKTFEGAMGNMQATVTSGMMSLYETYAKDKVVGAINSFNDKVGVGFSKLESVIPKAIEKVSPYWNVLKENAIEVKDAFGEAFSAIGGELKELSKSFGSTESIKSFSDVVKDVAGGLKTFAGFLKENDKTVAKVIANFPKMVLAFKGMKIAKAVAPGVFTFSRALLGLTGKGIGLIAGKLFGISKKQEEVGKSSSSSSKKMMASAKAFMMFGAGVALISGGFFLLAQGAKAVADSGPLAVGVLAGLVAVVAGLGLGMMKMLSTMSGGTKKLAVMSKAMIAFGASLLMVSAGFYVLSSAAINLASAGPLAIGVMVGMVAAIAGLMIVAKMAGPALTAGAVGLLAFGAAVIVAAAGMMVLTIAAISLANAGPLAIGVMFGLIVAIGGLMVVTAALGPALTAGAVGFVAFGIALVLVGTGALLASAALALVATVLPQVTSYGLAGAIAIMQLGVGMTVFAAGAAVAGAACVILGAGLVVVAAGLVLVGAAVLVTAAGFVVLGAGVKAVNSSMKSISKNAKSAEKSLKSMQGSAKVVSSGLDAIGNKAKSAMKALISAFDNAAGKASASGKKVGSGFNQGLRVGMISAVATSSAMTGTIVATLRAAQSGAYSSGVYIGQGLASGMRATLGTVRSVATQLAAAAEAAIRAKARIHSPSKVTDSLGRYYGEGWIDGLKRKLKESAKVARELVMIPELNKPELSLAGIGANGTLKEEYEYRRNASYTIVVPVEIDGRETARVIAPYTQEELERMETRDNRRHGRR